MDVKLALIAYVLPGLAIVLGIPVTGAWDGPSESRLLRLPNPKKLLSSNRRLVPCKPASPAGLWLWRESRRLATMLSSSTTTPIGLRRQKQFFMTLSTALMLLLAVFLSAFYIRKL